ncbi:unnamed protein product, partial [Vitis vinifera]
MGQISWSLLGGNSPSWLLECCFSGLGSPFILIEQRGVLWCFINQMSLPLVLKKFPQMRSLWSDRYENCPRELRN